LRGFDAERAMNRVTGTIDWSGFGNVDLVIEAVFEDLELKQSLLQEVEGVSGPGTVFASNTSSMPIATIAGVSARPENVVGMHYFSPVEKMPLLEVVVGPQTSVRAVATAVAFGRRQGKTVIVVGDGTGFYTSRILGPYVNEAAFLLGDGAAVDAVDDAMVAWGFPVGPLLLADEVGIDVGAKIAQIMIDAFGDRMRGPTFMEGLVTDGRRGRKNGRGFYRYDDKGKRGGVDDTVYEALGVGPPGVVSSTEIQERLSLAMINEAARCLEEGILGSGRDGDIGAVFGLGFPPFRGGPFWYVDHIGADHVVERLDALAARHGERFEPADILRKHAASGERFRAT
jgi:3-hydroxyacyl-CoA dehydrogenase/enoyl-CoA hydratase/3-hydroxybutyryl-CoA epimerase